MGILPVPSTGSPTSWSKDGQPPSPALRAAYSIVVVHRQATASAAAATVRIYRLVEAVEELAHLDATFVINTTFPFNEE